MLSLPGIFVNGVLIKSKSLELQSLGVEFE